MAQTKVEQNESAPDLLMRNHKSSKEDASVNFVTSEDDAKSLGKFLEAHKDELNSAADGTRPFLSINGSTIYGKKNQRVIGGLIPLFDGVAVNLETALLQGSKRWFSDPEVTGEGGLVTILPQNIDTAILLHMDKVHLKPEHIEAHAESHGTGFGKYNKVEPKQVDITQEQVTFRDVTFTAWQKEGSPEEAPSMVVDAMTLSPEGLMAPQMASDVLYNFLNFEPQAEPEVEEVVITPENKHIDIENIILKGKKSGISYQEFSFLHIDVVDGNATLTLEKDNKFYVLKEGFEDESGNYGAKSVDLEGLAIAGLDPDTFKGKLLNLVASKSASQNISFESLFQNLVLDGHCLYVDDINQRITWASEEEEEVSAEDFLGGLFDDDNSETTELDVEQFINDLAAGLDDAINALEQTLSQMGNDIEAFIARIADAITALPEDILNKIQEIMGNISQAMANMSNAIANLAKEIQDRITSFFESIANIPQALKDAFASLMERINGKIAEIMAAMAATLANAQQALKDLLAKILDIPENIRDAIASMINAMADSIAAMAAKLIAMGEGLKAGILAMIDAIVNFPEAVLDAIINKLNEIIAGVIDTLNGICNSIVDTVNSFVSAVASILQKIADIPVQLAEALAELARNVMQSLEDAAAAAAQAVKDGLAAIASLIGTIIGLPEDLRKAIEKAVQNIKDTLLAIAQSVANTISELCSKIAGIPQALIDNIMAGVNAIKSKINTMVEAIVAAAQKGIDALKDLMEAIANAPAALANFIKETMGSIKDVILDGAAAIGAVANNAIDFIQAIPENVENAVKDIIDLGKKAGMEYLLQLRDDLGLNPDAVQASIDAMFNDTIDVTAGENSSPESEGAAGAKLTLDVSIPVLPGISFKVGASAAYGVQYEMTKKADKIAGTINKDEGKTEVEPIKVTMGVNLTGAASVSAFMGVVLGADKLLNVEGLLSATLSLISSLNAKADTTVGMEKGAPKLYAIDLSSAISAQLIADLKGAITFNFLIWSKDLVSATLVEKNLGSIAGEIHLSRDFANNKDWILDGNANFQTLVGKGKEVLTKQESLEQFFTNTTQVEDLFQGNQSNFAALKEEFDLARKIVQLYHQKDGKTFVVADVNKADGGPTILAKKAVQISNSFYNQYMQNVDLINAHIRTINDTANNPAVQDALVKKAGLMQKQQELLSIQALLKSTNHKENEDGSSQLSDFISSVKGSEFVTYHFDDSLESEAKSKLQTPDAYKAYEEKRIAELEKPFRKRISQAKDYIDREGLDESQKSTDLASYYNNRWRNVYKSQFVNATESENLLAFVQKKTDKSREDNAKNIATHKSRIDKLGSLYDQLSDSEKTAPNEAFFSHYAGPEAKAFIGEKATSLKKHPIFTTSTKNMLKDFIETYATGKYADRLALLAKKDTLAKNMRDAQNLESLQETMGLDADQQLRLDADRELIAREVAKNTAAIDKDRHKIATMDDIILARKRVKKHGEITQDASDDAFRAAMKARILARNDSLDALIVYERSRPKSRPLPILEAAKKGYEDGTKSKEERYQIKRKAVESYLDSSRLKKLETAVRDEYRTDILYHDSELTDYEGQSSTHSAYMQMHQFGIRSSKNEVEVHDNHLQVAEIVKARTGGKVGAQDVLNYYQYTAEASGLLDKNQSPVVTLYTMRNTASTEELMAKLEETESLKKDYLSYISDNASKYMTPKTIMDYEQSRYHHYHDPHSSVVDSINSSGSFGNAKLEKAFLKETKANIGISYLDIVAMETLAMDGATAKHRDRLRILAEEKPTSASGLEGRGTKVSSKDINAMVDDFHASNDTMSSFTESFLEKEMAIQTEILDKVAASSETAKEELITLQEQSRICRIISDNAEAALSSPENIINEFGDFDDKVLSALEKQGQDLVAKTESTKKADTKLTALAATADKLLSALISPTETPEEMTV